MNKGKEQKKIASLQVVRALAFMGVFAFHCEVTELALKIGVSFGASMLVTWLYMVGQKRFAVKS